MSLKTDIVIRNEFTVKTSKGGSRGGTPGDYVLNYMARKGATEDMTPVRYRDIDSYVVRYMARSDAVEAVDTVPNLKRSMKGAQGHGGVAFGYGDVSLSHEKLMASSRDIQNRFDSGKTVMKTVLSFTQEYLKQMGVVDEDFECEKAGDYRGNLDQMKLRMAIMHGLDKLSRYYDDLQYVGVLQVDTKHVHCHLAMVDRGVGTVMPDGTQRGKLTKEMKRDLRRGVDDYLGQHEMVRQLSSNVEHDRHNALCFIKKFTHRAMSRQEAAQFMLACLPEDKRLWRADSNRKEMRKANHVVREYVADVLSRPDSGYREALRSVDAYARSRQRREGLSVEEYRKLYMQGRERLMLGCMDGVYSVLKQVPDRARDVRTPMMDVMSMDYEDMAAEAGSDPMIEFGFKLRSYSSRLEHHKKEREKYHEAVKRYERVEDVSESARPFVDFIRFEEEYNSMLMCKYQHFLSFLPPSGEYEDEYKSLLSDRKRRDGLAAMRSDKDMSGMGSSEAEAHGREKYGVGGGRYMVISPEVLDRRQYAVDAAYAERRREFAFRLAGYGLTLEDDAETGLPKVSTRKPYGFDDVKALDIHHMQYDFIGDVRISRLNVDAFVEAAEKRHELYRKAAAYLEGSGQGQVLEELPGQDVRRMKAVADSLRSSGVLSSRVSVSSGSRGGRTFRLDQDYQDSLDRAVLEAVQSSVEYE